jgi:translation elongation factor P/translation initiation factor 5A
VGSIFGWLFFRRLKGFIQNIKLIFIKISGICLLLIRQVNLFIQNIRKNPLKYGFIAVSILSLVLASIVIKPYIHFGPSPSDSQNNSYDISADTMKITHILAQSDGVINKISEKVAFFNANPDKTVTLNKGEAILFFDSAEIDKQLNDLQQKFYQLNGSRTVISQETIDSPDESELSLIQSQIDDLKIQEDQQKVDLINLESRYYQAKSLYDQKVVVQSYLDDASFKYAHAKSDIASLDAKISALEKLYEQKSLSTRHTQITITTRGTDEDSNKINSWLEENKKKIHDLTEQKAKLTVNTESNCILKSIYVRVGQNVKKGTALADVVELDNLVGVIQLKKEDLKLIKEEKAKLYFVNQNTSTKLEIQNYELVGNKLSFKLQGDQMVNHYKEAKVIVEKE